MRVGDLLSELRRRVVEVYRTDIDSDVLALWNLYKMAPGARYVVAIDMRLDWIAAYDLITNQQLFLAQTEDEEIDSDIASRILSAGRVYRARAGQYTAYVVVS
ncbi:MAG: hypothetical protein ACP5H5_10240 [Pyrobaculum sp.]